MALYKGFRVIVGDSVTPGFNVLADLGVVIFSFLESIPGKSNFSRNNPTISDLEEYTTEIGNGHSFCYYTENSSPELYNKACEYIPAISRIDTSQYVGNYLILLNDSGYYAAARILSSGATAFTGYSPEGTNIGSIEPLAMSYYATSVVACVGLATFDSSGVISSYEYSLVADVYTSFGATLAHVTITRYNMSQAIIDWWNNISQYVPPPTDPYTQGGESDVGGGTGNFDGTSVDVDFSSLPTLSAVDTGFITLYNPSLAQLQSLANYMWSGLFDIDTFKKLFADPMQAILGLSIVPGPVPSGSSQNVRIGNIDSGVVMTKAATQYIDIDCGTLNVEEFWGAYLDYEPYTKAEIFLPFIGVHQIAIDDIMNKSVHIKYHIDLLSGGCACEIKCGGSVLYTFIGSCAVSIPVTGSDWTNLLNGVLSAASAIGTMVATGGASAPAAASTIASAAVNSLKPSIEKSGSIAGAGGLLAGKVPVLILTRPRQALPGKQNTFTGYPAFITRSLGALSGYTEVHSIRLSGIDGTESEIDEIEELLKGGVIL